MTTYIPSITLPAAVFSNPAASILLPIALGSAVGFSVQRMHLPSPLNPIANCPSSTAKETQKTYMALKQPPYRPPPQVFGPAWTILYGLMGFAAYRACDTGTNPLASAEKLVLFKQGATLYTVQ
jgi:benzodiazapine receptor